MCHSGSAVHAWGSFTWCTCCGTVCSKRNHCCYTKFWGRHHFSHNCWWWCPLLHMWDICWLIFTDHVSTGGNAIAFLHLFVHPSISTLSFKPADLWSWSFACEWITSMACRELKPKVKVKVGIKFKMSQVNVRVRFKTRSVWPWFSVDDSFLVSRSTRKSLGIMTVSSDVDVVNWHLVGW